MATQAQIAAVQQLYIGYLGRAADKAGLDFWTNAVATGVSTLESVATGFTLSNEYKAAFGGLTNDALVEKVYTSVLGRASDTAGKAFWVDALAKGTVTADKLVATFIGALGAPDQTIINNKTFVAQTYTDTAGTTNFNAAAAVSVIANVDGTAASVAAATAAIANGTVGGLTPGAALIAKVAAVQAEITALEKATAGTNPTFDTDKNGSVDKGEAQGVHGLAVTARNAVDTKTTAVLTDEAATAAKALSDASALVDASGAAAVAAKSAYINAVAAQKALVGSTAAVKEVVGSGTEGQPGYVAPVTGQTAAEVAEANAMTGATTAMTAVNSSLNAAGAATTYAKLNVAFGGTEANQKIANATDLKGALNSVNGTAIKAALIAELQKLPTFGQAAIDAVSKEAAIIAANSAVNKASTATGFGDTGYVAAAKADAAAADLVVKATAADAAVAAAKVVVDKFLALDTKSTLAVTELNTFKAANIDKVSITDLTKNGVTSVDATAKSDVFYFTKVAAADDFNIGGTAASTFGVGDSIVLGSAYTGNAGALTTGNHSALEVFFVQNATGTQVVIETKAVGSATTVVDASGNVTASPDAAVINLVGVTADHLSVANGVVSYV